MKSEKWVCDQCKVFSSTIGKRCPCYSSNCMARKIEVKKIRFSRKEVISLLDLVGNSGEQKIDWDEWIDNIELNTP